MKKSLSNHRPPVNTKLAEKAFYNRLEQDYFFIRKIAINHTNPNGVEPIICNRIEKILCHQHGCIHIKPKLKTLLHKYQALLQCIQNEPNL